MVERCVSSLEVKNVGFIAQCLWKYALSSVVVMVSLWCVVRPGGRAESAHRLSNLMVVQTVRLVEAGTCLRGGEPGYVPWIFFAIVFGIYFVFLC